ncbi:MAG: penicillin acylase family protein, partial [Pseudomonadota bacterium]
MALLFQWLMRLAAGSLALIVLACVLAYYLAARSLPDYDKTLTVSGITAPIEIVRSNANVPHIFAETDPDVFFGLGYAHAQDRLWQMVILRRTVQGRLSEMFGTRTVTTDTVMRRLALYEAARASVDDQDAYTQEALRAYAAGVNARVAEINSDALGRGAPEFFLFDAPIAPWQPADSLALVKLMAVQLSGHLEAEVLRARVSLLLPDEDRVSDILPDVPGQSVAALPDYAALMPGAPAPFATASSGTNAQPGDPRYTGFLSPFPSLAHAGASNAWSATSERSATGGTLLANDPHLDFSAPAIWYLARLDLNDHGVMGATIPGIPAVLAGRSDDLGWGVTSSYLDDQDLFIEEVNPDNPEQYRTPDGFKPFTTRRAIIEIRDAAPVTLTLRWTENGPVLPPSFRNVGEITPPGHVAALSWTALSTEDTTLSAAVGLMRAKGIDDALEAAAAFVAPSLNLTLASGERIALQMVGAMPERFPDHQSRGRLPTLGAIADNRWQGLLPFEDNPRYLDPDGGIVGNTNNKNTDAPFPRHVSYDWGDSQRVRRWERLMQAREVHTRDSFIEAQLDTVSFAAQALLPLVGRELWFTTEAASEGTTERNRQRALRLLAEWNGEMNEHLPEPLIYATWLRFLQDRLIRDELGPLAAEFTHVEPLFIERVYRNVGGAGIWCDVLQSTAVETCDEIARLALDDAVIWLDETYGTALESLRWGDAHQATHDHPVLGEVPVLRY